MQDELRVKIKFTEALQKIQFGFFLNNHYYNCLLTTIHLHIHVTNKTIYRYCINTVQLLLSYIHTFPGEVIIIAGPNVDHKTHFYEKDTRGAGGSLEFQSQV